MKIVSIKKLNIPEILVIKYERFSDQRGYFTETYRKSDFLSKEIIEKKPIVQINESYSKKGVVRGLHFQWKPYMGKLVRTVQGRMIDMALDIRMGSPTYGKIILYDMPSRPKDSHSEWIWVPPGFAHGNFYTENTIIEYFCTGEYSPGNETGISPLAEDIDWSFCNRKLKNEFNKIIKSRMIISDKDKNGLDIQKWSDDPRSKNFIYEKLK